QHASPRILKAMKRPANAENNLARIQQWRQVCPEITLRSTFIVGFPGETEAEFDELLAFLQEAQLDRVGCFAYSAVEGAAANQLPDAVPEEIKEDRRRRFMELQEEISRQRLAAKVGREMTVMVDELIDGQVIARSSADAPEIDGLVYVDRAGDVQPGDFIAVEITGSDAHDLFAVASD
ncbi:MAG: radical SAM protein, partial [Nitrosomonas sp.]